MTAVASRTAPRSAAERPGRWRMARTLHPIAWWVWAIGLATAVSRTTNPLLLLLVLAVLGLVVANRRTEAPWARAFKYYLAMALIVVAIRVVFRSIFSGGVAPTDHVLFRLPQLHSPSWYAGIALGGPVSVESVLSATFDGLRLGCLLCCIGAANALANPKRALRVLPGALYELGVAVVVSISVAPQLVESVQRVRRARRLRAGGGKGIRALRGIVVPVLEDALDRSLRLAAAMDSRGYGRTGTSASGTQPAKGPGAPGWDAAGRRLTATLILAGMCGLCVGAYGLLDGSAPYALGLPAIIAGGVLCCLGLGIGGRRVRRTRYRPDPWRVSEWVVAGGGVLAAGLLFAGIGSNATGLNPPISPLTLSSVVPLPLVPAATIVLAGLAGMAAPPPERVR